MCNLPLVSDADSPPTDNRDFSPALSLTDCVTTYGGNVALRQVSWVPNGGTWEGSRCNPPQHRRTMLMRLVAW